MLRLNFFAWFENLKTQAKLLTVFGLVGVIIAAMAGVGVVTSTRLSTQAETMYTDYTIAYSGRELRCHGVTILCTRGR